MEKLCLFSVGVQYCSFSIQAGTLDLRNVIDKVNPLEDVPTGNSLPQNHGESNSSNNSNTNCSSNSNTNSDINVYPDYTVVNNTTFEENLVRLPGMNKELLESIKQLMKQSSVSDSNLDNRNIHLAGGLLQDHIEKEKASKVTTEKVINQT